ncbi:MAG: peptidyl-prolyl cis-trans isomerase [Pseudanabaenales cyanobacterium]|nr:peptidyl-prolyl cis-trans isomerase [Pseudanabaenales cyanobacterium]
MSLIKKSFFFASFWYRRSRFGNPTGVIALQLGGACTLGLYFRESKSIFRGAFMRVESDDTSTIEAIQTHHQSASELRPTHPETWIHWLIREPLVHFLLIGALLFGLHTYIHKINGANRIDLITVSPQLVTQLSKTWEGQWKRPPTAQELQHLIESNVQEEVLYREALAMNLDQNDTIVRRWLVQKMDFLSRDMIPPVEPTDEEIKAYFEDHSQDYVQPARVSFTHIFFNADSRGEQVNFDAVAALNQLNSDNPIRDRAPQLGDSFMLNYDYIAQTPLDVRQYFGKPFTDALFELEPGQWRGPVESSYGLHLIRISDRRSEQSADLSQVYEEVKRTLMDERRIEANDAFYQALLSKYTLKVDDSVLAEHPDLNVVLEGFNRQAAGALNSGSGFNILGH